MYSRFTLPTPYRNFQGQVTGVYREREPILRVSVVSPASGQPMPGKAWLSTERFYTADSRNATDYVGKRVELQDINGQLTIMRILPEPGEAPAAEVKVGAGDAKVDGNSVSVTQGGDGATFTPTNSEFRYGNYGLSVSDERLTLTAAESSINTLADAGTANLNGAFIFARAGVPVDSGDRYQFLVIDAANAATEIEVRNDQNEVIGKWRLADLGKRTEGVLAHDSAVVGGNRSRSAVATPTNLTYTISYFPQSGITERGININYDWTGDAAGIYDGRTYSARPPWTGSDLLTGRTIAIGRSNLTAPFFNRMQKPLAYTNHIGSSFSGNTSENLLWHLWVRSIDSSAYISTINNGGVAVYPRRITQLFGVERDYLILNSATPGAISVTTANDGNTATITLTIPSRYRVTQDGNLIASPSDEAGWATYINEVSIVLYQVRRYNPTLQVYSDWSAPYVAVRLWLKDGYEWFDTG